MVCFNCHFGTSCSIYIKPQLLSQNELLRMKKWKRKPSYRPILTMERPARAPPARAPPLPPCPIHRISNTRAQACLEQSIRKASNVPRKVAHLVRTAATDRSTPWPRRRWRGGGRTARAGTEAKRLAAGTLGWMEEKVKGDERLG